MTIMANVPTPAETGHLSGRHQSCQLAKEMTRVLLLAGGAYGELLALAAPTGNSLAVFHRTLTGESRQGSHHDAIAIKLAALARLVELGEPIHRRVPGGEVCPVAPVTLTDVGRAWLIAYRVHGVPIQLGQPDTAEHPLCAAQPEAAARRPA